MLNTLPNIPNHRRVVETGFMLSTTLYATIISTNAYCTHELFNNGVHHIVIKKVEPGTVDAYFEILDEIYSTSQSTETVRILNDSNLGALSVSTLISRVRPMLKKHPHLTRHAILVTESLYQTQIIDILMSTMPIPRHKMRYHRADEELQAIEWLLRDN
jgi:hypothetical protein